MAVSSLIDKLVDFVNNISISNIVSSSTSTPQSDEKSDPNIITINHTQIQHTSLSPPNNKNQNSYNHQHALHHINNSNPKSNDNDNPSSDTTNPSSGIENKKEEQDININPTAEDTETSDDNNENEPDLQRQQPEVDTLTMHTSNLSNTSNPDDSKQTQPDEPQSISDNTPEPQQTLHGQINKSMTINITSLHEENTTVINDDNKEQAAPPNPEAMQEFKSLTINITSHDEVDDEKRKANEDEKDNNTNPGVIAKPLSIEITNVQLATQYSSKSLLFTKNQKSNNSSSNLSPTNLSPASTQDPEVVTDIDPTTNWSRQKPTPLLYNNDNTDNDSNNINNEEYDKFDTGHILRTSLSRPSTIGKTIGAGSRSLRFSTSIASTGSNRFSNASNRGSTASTRLSNASHRFSNISQRGSTASNRGLSVASLFEEKTTTTTTSTEIMDEQDVDAIMNYGFGIGFSYYKNWNLYYEYIERKYDNLKEELLTNPICNINIQQYQMIHKKGLELEVRIESAQLLGKNAYAKNDEYWNELFEIEKDTKISLQHILSILFYTDLTELPKDMKCACRKLHLNEPPGLVKERHRNLVNWLKLMFETIVLYGDKYTTKSSPVYHGLDAKFYFNQFKAKFRIPTSTTTDMAVARNFEKDYGITVEFGGFESIGERYFNTQPIR